MEQGTVEIPLPKEAGYAWSWLTQASGNWSETTNIKPVQLNASFANKQTLQGGWLKLKPASEDSK